MKVDFKSLFISQNAFKLQKRFGVTFVEIVSHLTQVQNKS